MTLVQIIKTNLFPLHMINTDYNIHMLVQISLFILYRERIYCNFISYLLNMGILESSIAVECLSSLKLTAVRFLSHFLF